MSASPEPPSEVCAVLVTHHPDDGFAPRLARIARQVGASIIVDNGSSDETLAMLRGVAAAPSITLIANLDNLGVARALNIGVQRAAALGFRSALLFDQDSVAGEGLVASLLEIRDSFASTERIAVVGSGYDEPWQRAPAPAAGLSHGDTWYEVESVITSGSLLDIAAYFEVGPFRDAFFIDYVDTEFCLRARGQGYRVVKAKQALMSHAIGAPTLHQALWIKKWTTNHSADRRYYIARNDTVLLREYGGYRGPGWALKSLQRRLRTCKRVLLYERQKTAKIRAIVSGWWDGVHGRLGPRRPGAGGVQPPPKRRQ